MRKVVRQGILATGFVQPAAQRTAGRAYSGQEMGMQETQVLATTWNLAEVVHSDWTYILYEECSKEKTTIRCLQVTTATTSKIDLRKDI